MQISKLYSNFKNHFHDIEFNENSINVIYADITDPENYDKDTHNLGKTTLIDLIDFMLLKKRTDENFLFKHYALFKNYVFYIELRLPSRSKYLTIRRAVNSHTKISFFEHDSRNQDFSDEIMDIWSYTDVPLNKAKTILDAYLSFRVIKPWSYRTGLPYFLRSQHDYQDVFQPNQYKGKHKDWKPYLIQILGFDGQQMERTYDIDDDIHDVESQIRLERREFPGTIDSIDKLNGKILVIDNEICNIESSFDSFNFKEIDERISDELVTKIDTSIAALNEIRYSMNTEAEKIKKQLELDCVEDVNKTKKVFEDASFYFSDQLINDYNKLVEFNRKITTDRKRFLSTRHSSLMAELQSINEDLSRFNEERQEALSILKETNTGRRMKAYQKQLIELKTQRELLERMKELILKLEALEKRIKELKTERSNTVDSIEQQIKIGNRTYNEIRMCFSNAVKEVLGEEAIISITKNKNDNFEFEAEIVDTGRITSLSRGTSYKQVLCAMFDLSVLQVYANQPFFKFVYHDGILEGLDDRKKIQLLNYVKRVCVESGIQYIITVIASDWPHDASYEYTLDNDDIVLKLHDKDSSGRLFNMPVF
ncbi:MAG: DUF2326 domain-containing protein [Candidatus Cloacimonadaceae bacterium]|nr:DUF2326 domain-containing protein [Candidatus Cloacimonadaceae bacterium]